MRWLGCRADLYGRYYLTVSSFSGGVLHDLRLPGRCHGITGEYDQVGRCKNHQYTANVMNDCRHYGCQPAHAAGQDGKGIEGQSEYNIDVAAKRRKKRKS